MTGNRGVTPAIFQFCGNNTLFVTSSSLVTLQVTGGEFCTFMGNTGGNPIKSRLAPYSTTAGMDKQI